MGTTFDLDATLRWLRHAQRERIERRPDQHLPFLTEASDLSGQALLLDTCVYIDQLRAHAPAIVEDVVSVRIVHHSVIALQELLHSVAVLNPADVRTPGTIRQIRAIVETMRPHRILEVDVETSARASLLSGVLCRLRNYGRDSRLRALADATLMLQAQRAGLTLLTSNIGDFDLLLQMVPACRVLMYRRTTG